MCQLPFCLCLRLFSGWRFQGDNLCPDNSGGNAHIAPCKNFRNFLDGIAFLQCPHDLGIELFNGFLPCFAKCLVGKIVQRLSSRFQVCIRYSYEFAHCYLMRLALQVGLGSRAVIQLHRECLQALEQVFGSQVHIFQFL